MKNLYLTALLNQATELELGQHPGPLIKQAGLRSLLRIGVDSTRRGAGRLMGRKTDDLSRSINKARSRYVEDGVTKARHTAPTEGAYGNLPKFNNRAAVKAHRGTADTMEKWAPRAAAGATGLAALGGSAYGGHKASQYATARHIENMPLLERLAAAGLLAFNPSSFGDRLRG